MVLDLNKAIFVGTSSYWVIIRQHPFILSHTGSVIYITYRFDMI